MVRFSTYLHIFTFVVLIDLFLRNDVYLIIFLLCDSNISIFPISCDFNGFKFFWSCPTLWKKVSFLFNVFFTIILGIISCASVLVISWWKYNPFSAFVFVSLGVSFLHMLCEWLPQFGVLSSFLFSIQATLLFSISVFISVRLVPIFWASFI